MRTIPGFIAFVFMITVLSGCSGTAATGVSLTDVLPASTPVATLPPSMTSVQGAPTLSNQIPKDGLILATHVDRGDACYDIAVYDDDRCFVVSCRPGFTYPSPQGSMDAYESSYLRRWAKTFRSFEEPSDPSLLIFMGTGPAVAEFADKAAMRALLGDIEWRAHGFVHRGGWPSAVFVALSVSSQRLAIPLDHQNVLQFEVVDFPDTCLAAPRPNEVCADVVTQGLQIKIVAEGMLYEYHTDALGYEIRPYGEPQVAPTQGPAG